MLLEVLTRHYTARPAGLARNQASLEAQTCDDWQQTLLIDDVGRGVRWANENMGRYAPQVEGDYVWVLDDDDYCTCSTLVEDVGRIVAEHKPDAIMVKSEVNRFGVLPDGAHWGKPPAYTHVCMSNFILRREVFQRHAPGTLTAELGADFRLIQSVFDAGHSIYWHDAVVMRSPHASWGKAE